MSARTHVGKALDGAQEVLVDDLGLEQLLLPLPLVGPRPPPLQHRLPCSVEPLARDHLHQVLLPLVQAARVRCVSARRG